MLFRVYLPSHFMYLFGVMQLDRHYVKFKSIPKEYLNYSLNTSHIDLIYNVYLQVQHEGIVP